MIVDASVWISMVSNTEVNYLRSRSWFRASMEASVELGIPSLALAEVAGAIARRRQASVQSVHRLMNWMVRLPNMEVHPLHHQLALRAVDIAAAYQLRGADAVYVATANELGMTLVTWDVELKERAAPLIRVIQP